MSVALCAFLLCDTGRPANVLRSENLGGRWTPLENVTDLGLRAQRFRNQTLNRVETWHQAESGEWFLRVKDGLYVLAAPTDSGPWETRPTVQLQYRDGAWVRASRTRDR